MTDHKKVQKHDLLAFLYFVKVKDVKNNGNTLVVSDVDKKNFEFDVNGTDLIMTALSADQYTKTEKVTLTRCAEILVSSFNTPFTAVFTKEDGTERTLRGRLIYPEPLLGRSKVFDCDVDSGAPIRLIDHRGLRSLTVNGTKYEVKK